MWGTKDAQSESPIIVFYGEAEQAELLRICARVAGGILLRFCDAVPSTKSAECLAKNTWLMVLPGEKISEHVSELIYDKKRWRHDEMVQVSSHAFVL